MATPEIAKYSPISVLHFSIIRWISDNFYLCKGCTIPRSLLYELYVENCNSKNPVNSATFGKIVRLVFPHLGTRRLGTRGSTRYHYDGIAIKSSSSFYAHYCLLLSEKKYHRHRSPGEVSSPDEQPSTSAAIGFGHEVSYKTNSQKEGTSENLDCSPSATYLKTENESFQNPWPEFNRLYLWEQDLGKKYPYEMVILLANEYCSYCQDILSMVRKGELGQVEGCITSFWKSLQPEGIMLMSFPDVCQLFKSYDRQLFKEMESILLHDFLEEMPLPHLQSIRVFSKKIELWLLKALEEFPVPLQTSKSEEVSVFIKRLRRKTSLCNMAKTMRTVLRSNSKVTVLRSNLRAVMDQELLDVPGNLFRTKFRNPEELQNDIEFKCFNDLMYLLAHSTDIRFLLNCVSSNLQAFVIQPCRTKEEFRKVASDFQLRWNFLLSAVSKAMTLKSADSFGSWHLFNLLLMDFVAHIFLCYMEEVDDSFWVTNQNDSSVVWVYEPSHLWGHFSEKQAQASAPQPAFVTLMQSQNNFGLGSTF